jgi:hypothetical protein
LKKLLLFTLPTCLKQQQKKRVLNAKSLNILLINVYKNLQLKKNDEKNTKQKQKKLVKNKKYKNKEIKSTKFKQKLVFKFTQM